MAKARLIYPFEALQGTLSSSRFYARVLHGHCILQRKPRRSSPRQRAMRLAFGQKYQGARYLSKTVAPP